MDRSHSRLLRVPRLALVALVLSGACAGGVGPSSTPAPDPTGTPRSSPSGPMPLVDAAWPTRMREHVDLWLHAYALLTPDTTLVPYFRRGYVERVANVRRQRNVTTQLDANRAILVQRFGLNPTLATSGQFLPLYFESWEQMRMEIERFVRAGGNHLTGKAVGREAARGARRLCREILTAVC